MRRSPGITLLIVVSVRAWGLDPAHSIIQYGHTSWTSQDGIALPPINAIVQASDGYLWLGTQRGLWRFDGSRFLRWTSRGEGALPDEEIRTLIRAEGEGLWIGTRTGISLLVGSRIVNFDLPERFGQASVRSLLDDAGKGIWAGVTGPGAGGLFMLRPPAQLAERVDGGFAGTGVNALFQDQETNLWVGTRKGLWRLHGGKVDEIPMSRGAEVYAITADIEGRLVIAANLRDRLVRLSNGKLEPILNHAPALGTNVRSLVSVRDGALWAGTFSDGLVRIRKGEMEPFTKERGLSGSMVQALYEDREGNIWVGTRTGLDRFGNAGIAKVTADDGLSEDLVTAILVGSDGSIIVGTAKAGLNRIYPGGARKIEKANGLPNASILSLYEDPSKNLWVGTMGGLFVESHGRFKAVLEAKTSTLDRVTAMTGDQKGNVWVADAKRGLFKIAPSGETSPVRSAHLPPAGDVYALMADRSGRLWLGFYHGSVVDIKDETVTLHACGTGGLPAAVLSFYQDKAGSIWVGTSSGICRLRKGVWTSWTRENGLPEGGIWGIVEDDSGGLWLTTESGLLRAPVKQLSRQKDNAAEAFPFMTFGTADGVRPQLGAVRAQPRVAKTRDGQLWFAMEEGLAMVDPANLRRNAGVPRATIDELKVAGTPVPVARHGVAFHARELEFEYAAPSLSSRGAIRFRYQLEGLDNSWVDAGHRTHASYGNLLPGSYRFRVTACDGDGQCDDKGAEMSFALLPAFYQTWWFRGLGLAISAGLLIIMFAIRLSVLRKEFAIRLQERLAERTRIARELHDTLLQMVVGTSLQLQSTARALPEGSSARSDLERLRRNVDDALREARKSVQALRSPSAGAQYLLTKLRDTGAALTIGQPIHFSIATQGKPEAYPDDIQDQLVRIGQEAIGNAVRHSHGTWVRLNLCYGRRSLRLEVADNGTGIPEEKLELNFPGHFGIRGMQERAAAIGAGLQVAGRPGGGTFISVTARRRTLSRLKAQVLKYFRPAQRSGDEAAEL